MQHAGKTRTTQRRGRILFVTATTESFSRAARPQASTRRILFIYNMLCASDKTKPEHLFLFSATKHTRLQQTFRLTSMIAYECCFFLLPAATRAGARAVATACVELAPFLRNSVLWAFVFNMLGGGNHARGTARRACESGQ